MIAFYIQMPERLGQDTSATKLLKKLTSAQLIELRDLVDSELKNRYL